MTRNRRHDLDALRAAAMLLGIVFHISLSFAAGATWLVQDVSRHRGWYWFESAAHGFRMQLFMLVSGYFTAMLWRQKGLKALLWHRCRRVLFPLLAGFVTIIPLTNWASLHAQSAGAARRAAEAQNEPPAASVWAAIRHGDAAALGSHLDKGAGEQQHPVFGFTPLTWAALCGQPDCARLLLDRGAPVNGRNRDGGTALHAAAFFGREDVAALLLDRGADVSAASDPGERPAESAGHDWGTVQFIADLLSVKVEPPAVEAGRRKILTRLPAAAGANTGKRSAVPGILTAPVLAHLWFLWLLVLLAAAFALIVFIAGRLGGKSPSLQTLTSPWMLGAFLFLTCLTMWPMTVRREFGPDTSLSLLPVWPVLAHYAVFFLFGALYSAAGDSEGNDTLGASWRWLLPPALLIIFPLGMEAAAGERLPLPETSRRLLAALLQSLYAWIMSLGCIGMFRTLFSRGSRTVRWVSDSSYWLYLAHLPLVIWLQTLAAGWPLPSAVKLPAITLCTLALLFLSYRLFVRYTCIGRLLNGPRSRSPERAAPAADSP